MAIEDPEGPISEAIDQCRELLRLSPTWQAWATGEGEATDAHIYEVDSLPYSNVAYTRPQIVALRPFAIANVLPARGVEVRMVSADGFAEVTRVEFEFQDNVAPPPTPYREVSRQFNNRIGKIIRELADASLDGGGRPLVTGLYTICPATRIGPDERASQGDFLFLRLVVEIGFGGRR